MNNGSNVTERAQKTDMTVTDQIWWRPHEDMHESQEDYVDLCRETLKAGQIHIKSYVFMQLQIRW